MRRPLRTSSGFTLIELLVALAIVSAVAVLSWQGLENVIRLTNRVRSTDEELAQLRSVFGQLAFDLKGVANPRTDLPNAAGNGGGGGGSSSAGTTPPPGSNERNVSLRTERRPDVTFEDENSLDGVVDELLRKGEKIQLLSDGLQIQTLQKSPLEGLSALLVTWRFDQGRLLRVSRPLKAKPEGTDSGQPGAVTNFNALAAEEMPLQVAGFSVRLWSEGKGWTTERSFGAVLPPPPESIAQTGQPAADANANPNAAGPASARTMGVEVRLLMLSGKLYNRVFLVGSAS